VTRFVIVGTSLLWLAGLAGAASAADLGRWDECIRMARVILERNAEDVNGHYSIARGLAGKNQFEPAVAHFNIAMPASVLWRIPADAASSLRKLGRPKEAAEALTKADRLKPDHVPILINLAAASLEAGDAQLAEHALKKLAALDPQGQALRIMIDLLAELKRAPQSPPNLSGEIRSVGKLGPVNCDACDARVHLFNERDSLCAGCGALLPGVPRGVVPDPCPYCGADGSLSGFLAALPINWRCPYCHSGTVRAEALASGRPSISGNVKPPGDASQPPPAGRKSRSWWSWTRFKSH
jgi:hypothetical protein